MKIRNKKIIAIITILVITIIYGIWKENRGKIKIENINEQAEITDIEDNGNGVSFNVFVYNVQPGIYINYATGESKAAVH